MMSILVITVDHPDKEVEDELIAKYQKKIFEFDDKKADLHRDSGFDLFVPEKQVLDENDHMLSLNHGVRAACYSYPELKPLPYYLYPRSSISKTPFRMANSVGIIDSGYRGHLLAKLDCIQEKEEAVIEKHSRLFQVCSPNLLPFDSIYLVDKTDSRFKKKATKRGSGGFGSTGK